MTTSESNAKGEFKMETLGREILRLNADGTYWIAEDVTDEEMRKVFPGLVRVAASLNFGVLECKAKHQA